jgi:alkylated DNA repair dioxygenase AlkB
MSTARTIPLADGGTLLYDPHFLSPEEADELFATLKARTAWRQERSAFGHPFPRLTAYHADPGVTYAYSGVEHESVPWPDYLAEVRRRIEEVAGAAFNSLLLNYYRGGQDSVGWHADDEPELGPDPVVPSVSLGGVRRFVLRHNRTREKREFDLGHGSLLLMGGTCQRFWKHAVPKTSAPVAERINLTFRNILAG